MPSLDIARISSLASAVEDMSRTAADLAGELEGGLDSDAASALYEAERSLRMAGRAVERARRVVARD